jgi:hypothetical protein
MELSKGYNHFDEITPLYETYTHFFSKVNQ